MIGSVVEDCTRATSCGESTSDAIIQDAPTDWMRPPKFEAMLAIQTARKVDICSGDGVKFPANSGEVLVRSEEHTSELQSLMRISYAVFCLKKKKNKKNK